jgi:hypothetical protein
MRSIQAFAFARLLAAGCGAFALVTNASAAGDKPAYDRALARAAASYDADARHCDTLRGNTRDVCRAEANEARTKREQDAEAAFRGTAKARARAEEAVAEAHYKVVRERCDERSGNDRDVCVKVAKAELAKAKAVAKAHRRIAEARGDAAKERREADYRIATSKCDALSGDEKTACVRDARARFGM